MRNSSPTYHELYGLCIYFLFDAYEKLDAYAHG